MRHTNCLLIVVLALVCLLAIPGYTLARDYVFRDLLIDVQMGDDGTLSIVERRTVQFEGEYTGLFQWIDLRDDMEISNVTVSEFGQVYEYNDAHNIGPSGTYYAELRNNQMYIDWSFEARDEIRTFEIRYDVHNVVLVHNDVAELYYMFVGDKWERGSEHVLVTLTLPEGATRGDIRAWGHGPLHGEVRILDEQRIEWEISPLNAQTMLEGRITFPPELVPLAPIRTGVDGLAGILSEEEGRAARANLRRQLAQIDWIVALGVFIASISGAIFLWIRYGKAHPTDFAGDYYRELPQDYSPAELGVLWSMGTVQVKDLTATILDLARRKVLLLEEYELETKGVFKTSTKTDYRISLMGREETVSSHEEMLVDFLFDDVAQNEANVALEQVEKYAQKHRRKFAKFWQGWQAEVKLVAEQHNFFETDKKAQVTGALIGIGMMLLAVLPFIYGMLISGASLLVSGFIILLIAVLLKRRTISGNNDYVRWRAFRRFLRHFSEISRSNVPSLVVWEHYLVYAVTLGVAKEVLRQLEIVFPNLEEGGYQFGYGWFYFGMGRSMGLHSSMNNLTNSLQSSFSSSIQTATGQSSGSGTGGGFSGGGGGGFGGGGGGAR